MCFISFYVYYIMSTIQYTTIWLNDDDKSRRDSNGLDWTHIVVDCEGQAVDDLRVAIVIVLGHRRRRHRRRRHRIRLHR